MIRVGILGTGFGAKIQWPAFELDSRAKVVAVCGRDTAKTQTLAKSKSVKAYTRWQDLLAASDIDAIAMALPPPVQAQVLQNILEHAAQYKKHLFIEKPVFLGSAKTQALAKELDRLGLVHALDFEFPFLPAWQRLHQKLTGIGTIQRLQLNWHVKTTAYSTPNSWKPQISEGGGVLSNLACHSLHYIEWIMGGALSLSTNLSTEESQVDAILDFGAGKTAVMSVSMNTPFGNGHRLEVLGEEGSLTLENTGSDYMNGFVLKVRDAKGELAEEFDVDTRFADGRVVAVNRVVKRFLDGIAAGKSQGPNLLWPNLHDGARNELLIESCRKSHQSGQRILL